MTDSDHDFMYNLSNIILGVLIAAAFLGVYLQFSEEPDHCTEKAVVLDIVSVDYRDATVFTTKGTFTRNQDRFKTGDTICIKYGKEK